MFGTGRVAEIISYLRDTTGQKNISDIPVEIKLDAVCTALQLSSDELDALIASNSPVMRTVKGHSFEAFFDELMELSNQPVIPVGGDEAVDRIVNGYSLQLKTFTAAGTKEDHVQYKTHKTHGAKSEQESLDYYHDARHFADFLVGLVTYSPLRIMLIPNADLPRHSLDKHKIISPFNITWCDSEYLNAFDLIGVRDVASEHSLRCQEGELLPKTAAHLDITSDVILNTILTEENFRIWDMAIRGFARELAFEKLLNEHGVMHCSPITTGKERADKSDHAVQCPRLGYQYLQMKGLSTNNCLFAGVDSMVATETQLTRGRVNDHPTQSRLYLCTDFDYLIIGLDPSFVVKYELEVGNEEQHLQWKFYAIPTEDLETHPRMPHRIKSLQKFKYVDLDRYEIGVEWLSKWVKTT